MKPDKLSDITLISVDLFRTLIDVDRSLPQVWKIFLGECYTPELGEKYWDRATEIVMGLLDEAALDDQHFRSAKIIYQETYSRLFKEIKLDFDPGQAAAALIRGHQVNRLFTDAAPFLKKVGNKFPVILSTDADIDMLTGIDRIYPFDHIFISEELRTYKHNPRFFREVTAYYGLQPKNILHIGDSYHDIVTPAKEGIVTCWLNRHERVWQHATTPDFTVKSLMEILPLIVSD